MQNRPESTQNQRELSQKSDSSDTDEDTPRIQYWLRVPRQTEIEMRVVRPTSQPWENAAHIPTSELPEKPRVTLPTKEASRKARPARDDR